jgi:lipoprotein-anchoring transpeptidase ErfK/SrfK
MAKHGKHAAHISSESNAQEAFSSNSAQNTYAAAGAYSSESPVEGGYIPTFNVQTNEPPAPHKGLKMAGITVGVVVAVILAIYIAGVVYFSGHFFPNTTLVGMNISGKTPEEVHQMLDDAMGDYTFKVEGQGLSLTLKAQDMGMTLDSELIADDLMAQTNPWTWPLEISKKHDDTEELQSTLADTKLSDTLTDAVTQFNATATASKDATISYNKDKKSYVIEEEVQGNTLIPEKVIEEVTSGTINFAPIVMLSDAVVESPSRTKDDEKLTQAVSEANKYLEGALTLTMGGKDMLEVTADDIAGCITVGDDLTITFNTDNLVADVKEKVNAMDTTGATRTYTRADGKTITVKGGDYGWITNSAETSQMVKEKLEAGEGGTYEIITIREAAQAADENGVDFGTRYIDVDLKEQHARFYDTDGKIIWESDIVSGKPTEDRATPEGTYYLKTNNGASTLKGYKADGTLDYETPVDYWMPFKDNSIGFHDASWQSQFGGTWYKDHGSHGCVNLPPAKAKELHELIKVGDVVIVHS